MNTPKPDEVMHNPRPVAGGERGRAETVYGMVIELETQPIPDDVAEACAWLSAAERRTGRLKDRVAAGDMLDILLDVEPPYPPIDTSLPAVPLAEAAPHIDAALEQELRAADRSVVHRLRVARALGTLRKAKS